MYVLEAFNCTHFMNYMNIISKINVSIDELKQIQKARLSEENFYGQFFSLYVIAAKGNHIQADFESTKNAFVSWPLHLRGGKMFESDFKHPSISPA